MSGIRYTFQTVEVTTGTAKKTLLQVLAAANHRVLVKEISISFDGISNTAAPILVQVLRQSTSGIGGDVLAAVKLNVSDDEAIQATGLSNIDGTTAPTDTDELLGELVHPQGGFNWQAPFGGELVVKGGNRLGIAVTAGAAVNAKVRLVCEE